jgi:hypothetical protein
VLGTTSLVPAVPTAERRCQAKWATGCRELATVPSEAARLQGWTAVPVQPAEPTVERGQRPALALAARTVRQEGWMLVPTEPTVGAVCRAMTALSTQPTAAVQRGRTAVRRQPTADQMGRTLRATEVTAQQGRTALATEGTAIQRGKTAVRAK